MKRTTPKRFDHHAFAVITSIGTTIQIANIALPKGWFRRLLDREPQAAVSIIIGGLAVLMPVTVIPLRHYLGYDTSNYYEDE